MSVLVRLGWSESKVLERSGTDLECDLVSTVSQQYHFLCRFISIFILSFFRSPCSVVKFACNIPPTHASTNRLSSVTVEVLTREIGFKKRLQSFTSNKHSKTKQNRFLAIPTKQAIPFKQVLLLLLDSSGRTILDGFGLRILSTPQSVLAIRLLRRKANSPLLFPPSDPRSPSYLPLLLLYRLQRLSNVS